MIYGRTQLVIDTAKLLLLGVNVALISRTPPHHLYVSEPDIRFIIDSSGWVPLRYMRFSSKENK